MLSDSVNSHGWPARSGLWGISSLVQHLFIYAKPWAPSPVEGVRRISEW